MRRIVKIFAWGFSLAICALLISQWLVISSAKGRTYSDVKQLPADNRVALVLGCAKTTAGGRQNYYFTRRIEAAAALYHAGKCTAFIVSGDNSVEGYDEPTDMKEALMAKGVPEASIYCDFAGFRTLDSVVRAKAIFGQSRLLVISQRTHNQRAIYLARSHGLDAIGYNARNVSTSWQKDLKNWGREVLARAGAVIDIQVLGTKPKFLGPPVHIAQGRVTPQ